MRSPFFLRHRLINLPKAGLGLSASVDACIDTTFGGRLAGRRLRSSVPAETSALSSSAARWRSHSLLRFIFIALPLLEELRRLFRRHLKVAEGLHGWVRTEIGHSASIPIPRIRLGQRVQTDAPLKFFFQT